MRSPPRLSLSVRGAWEGWSWGVSMTQAWHCLLAFRVPGTTFPSDDKALSSGYGDVISRGSSQERAEAGAMAIGKRRLISPPAFSPPHHPSQLHCHSRHHSPSGFTGIPSLSSSRTAWNQKGWKSPGYHSPAGSGPHRMKVRFCAECHLGL